MEDINLRKSIELAIATEKLGAGFYGKLAEKFRDDKEISELFSILAKDEETHEAQFQALLDKVPAEDEGSREEEKYQYLTAVSISEFFAGDGGALKDIDKIKSTDDALARAFALEKATLLYYHAMQDILGQNDILDTVIALEKSHLVSVMKYLMTGAKMRGLSDNW
jgi:rubrerythrin